jgi:hypothetical protein
MNEALEPLINELPDEAQMGHDATIKREGGPKQVIKAPGRRQGVRLVTVSVGVYFVEEPGHWMALKGVLNWGTGAAAFTADIDVHNGTQFTVPASYLDFTIGFEKGGDERITEATVAAGLAEGTRPGRSAPTRTLDVAALEQGTSHTYRVPWFARSLMLFSSEPAFYDAGTSGARIVLHGGPDPAVDPSLILSPAQAGRFLFAAGGLSMPESARFVTVENVALADFRVRPTFGLCL